jgi:nitrogen regulatory protein PII
METDIYLIVTIINKGWGEKVLETSMKAGATGGTIVLGRGMGIHEQRTLLGISLEPEKEIVLSVVRSDERESILKEIVAATDLEKPGAGIAFTLPIDKVFGISHHFPKEVEDEFKEENGSKSSETADSAAESVKDDDVKPDAAADKNE